MGPLTSTLNRPATEDVLSQSLRTVILLAGSVRQGRLGTQIGRPIFDLPVENNRTILDLWRRQTQLLGERIGRLDLSVRVMIDRAAPPPVAEAYPLASGTASVQIERDPLDYRGTGGVLRDVAGTYDDTDILLVANAAQVLMEDLAELTLEMAEMKGDVTIISHSDGTPSGLLLVRCRALRDVPETGFIDMKEQALPMIALRHRVAVLERKSPVALPVLILADYITALRRYSKLRAGEHGVPGPFDEDWESSIAIVESGADVHPTARLHDAVVLKGGRVEADAVLANSLVCPGGVLKRKQMATDALISPSGAAGKRGERS